MAVRKPTLKDRIQQVTQEALARCHRIENQNTGEVFYQVESESDPTLEYEVHFTLGKGFTCTCPAGKEAFRTCYLGICKHCIWSYRHAQLYKEEMLRLEHIDRLVALGLTGDQAEEAVTHLLFVNSQAADDETLVRVWGAQGQKPDEETVKACQRRYEAHPFSILR